MTTENWDRVYTVNEYYDGPVLGVADYHGKPHIYQNQFSEENCEYTNRFLLTDIDPELFALVLEDWEIWMRWDAAYRQRKVSVETHPALPEERQRHGELSLLIGDRLKVDSASAFSKWARFRGDLRGGLEVEWLDSPATTS
jgi:hypothetical protein